MRVESLAVKVHYVVTLYLTIVLVILPSTSEARAMRDYEDKEQSMAGLPTWNPESGSREDWLRCHGIPCEDWERTKRKLFELKMATAGTGYDTGMLNETEDSLDNCIWLTEAQIDEIMIQMEINAFEEYEEEESYVGQGQGQSQGQGRGQGQNQGQGQSQGQGQDRGRPQRRQKRKIKDFESEAFGMWPMPIHWKFDGMHNTDEQEIIRGAFRHWQAQTCVRFQELTINQPYTDHHILVTKEPTGCHSWIGRITTIPQDLNIQYGCLHNFGTPVHEIGHALGLWHEQQRWDRDDHIRVNWNNVGSYVGQFHRQKTPDLGVEYDHGSVMHYSPYDGSMNGLPTMEALNPWYMHNMGQRTGLSFNDAKIINLAYCADTCSAPLTQACLRNGYQDPNDCSRCKCPDGFSGKYCDHAAPAVRADCGGELTATSTPQQFQSPGYDSPGFYDGRPECSWLITAPVDHHIVFRFEDEFGLYCYNSQQCHHWVEVRYSMRLDIPGPRFCCYQRPDVTIRSESNELLVSFKTNYTVPWPTAKRGFKFSFFSEPSTAAATTPPTVRPAITTTTTARPTTRPTTQRTIQPTTKPTTEPTLTPTTRPSTARPTTTMKPPTGSNYTCPTPLLKACLRNGYQDPNDCSRCKCPDGFSGKYCDHVAPAVRAVCGGEVRATSTPQKDQSPGYNNPGFYKGRPECSWLITAPVDHHVVFRFEDEFGLYCYNSQQCHHWVEVRYSMRLDIPGSRFCCYQRPDVTIRSESNEMLVSFKTNYTVNSTNENRGFKFSFFSEPSTAADNTLPTTIVRAATTTTTTARPTTRPTTLCERMDLTFVLDSSGSVMQENWPRALRLVSDVAMRLPIGPDGVQVAVVTYGNEGTVEFGLSEHGTLEEIMIATAGILFKDQFTNTSEGIRLTRDRVYGAGKGSRDGVRKVAIIVTDGEAIVAREDTVREAEMAREAGIELFVVGVGKAVNVREAEEVAGSMDLVIFFPDFDSLAEDRLNAGKILLDEKICRDDNTVIGPSVDWSCSFEPEVGLCGITQEFADDQFDWTIMTGKTPSRDTGPSEASDGRYYIYIEASNPRAPGDRAILYLPRLKAQGTVCLQFSYHMYGFHVDTLTVLKKTPIGEMIPAWIISRDQGNQWRHASVSVAMNTDDRLAVIGIRGNEYSGDIAIDDLHVTSGPC